MKPICLFLIFTTSIISSCKRGSGHADPDENAVLFQADKDQQDPELNKLQTEPLIPSPLDAEKKPKVLVDDTPILVKPNLSAPPVRIETPPPVVPPEEIPRAEPSPTEPTIQKKTDFPTLTSVPKAQHNSAEEYANGLTRFTEVKKRLIPSLKKTIQQRGFHLGDAVFIRIIKQENAVEVFLKSKSSNTFSLLHTYHIAAMSGSLGPKKKEGDKQAPEGFYYVPYRSLNPASNFHLSFDLGYPNTYDKAHDYTGSFLMMHGSNVSIGCFAMTDQAIEEIYTICEAALQSGAQKFFRVHSFPFRMTEENMKQNQSNPNYAFWKNLKEGYDYFEQNHIPPSISVSNKKYIVSSAK